MTTLYHNPRCSKSRQTLELLHTKGITPEIVEYLKNPPSAEQLDKILIILEKEPQEILRTQEEIYETLGLKDKNLTRKEWIELIVKNPILMERPIFVTDQNAVIGRPPENVLEIL